MRNTALAFKDEYEVPVSSIEVIEANVAALRNSLNEFKAEVRRGLRICVTRSRISTARSSPCARSTTGTSSGSPERSMPANQEVSQLSKAVAQSDAKLALQRGFWLA